MKESRPVRDRPASVIHALLDTGKHRYLPELDDIKIHPDDWGNAEPVIRSSHGVGA